MKEQDARNLVEDLMEMPTPNIVVDMGGGALLSIDGYYHSSNKKGEAIIVLTAKRVKSNKYERA